MVCGDKLEYRSQSAPLSCYFCRETKPGTVSCISGHFVCDECHGQDALTAIKEIAYYTSSTIPSKIAEQIMSHPAVPMIGGEHHAIVAVSVMAALKNNGPVTYGDREICIDNETLKLAMRRTWTDNLPSCMCAHYGICGAAIGAGTVISILTEATCDVPKKMERQLAMKVTNDAAQRIAEFAGTCCKLSVRLAIEAASDALDRHFGVELPRERISCNHKRRNPYKCLGAACPYSGH